jgi:hypothetical protein
MNSNGQTLWVNEKRNVRERGKKSDEKNQGNYRRHQKKGRDEKIENDGTYRENIFVFSLGHFLEDLDRCPKPKPRIIL